MTKISIIIPVLNEAETISDHIVHLLNSSSKDNIAEIIVVDGGSTDDSTKLISQFSEVRLLKSEKGRARQMNLGANYATGDILYFLHADSKPPINFDLLIIEEINKGNLAGCFKMKFDSNHWWLKLAGWLTQFRWRACRGGDQSQFISKRLFEEINGFDEQFVIYEDNDLINKLYKRNEFVVIKEWLTTSSRKYKANGIWKLQYHFWAIYMMKWFGASPEKLFEYYKKNIV